MTASTFVPCLALALLTGAAQAQPVWRCGADGNRYSDAPCADGRIVQVDDTRSLERVAEARALASRERLLARELTAERRQREAEAGRQGAATLGVPATVSLQNGDRALKRPKAQKPQKPHRRGHRPADADTWPAADRASPRAPG